MARAAAGETILVTDRGRPVARLVPERADGLAALRAAGRVRPATRSLRDLPAAIPAEPGRPTLSELLAEQRRHER